jgi:hypothetical protein
LPDGESGGGTATLFRAERKRQGTGDRSSFFHSSFVESNGSVESELLQRVTGGVLWWSIEVGTESAHPGSPVGVAPDQLRVAWDGLGQNRPDVQSAAQNETAVDRPLVPGRPLIPRRAHLVIELESERSRGRAPALIDGLDRELNTFEVTRGESMPRRAGTYLRVGSEWMRFVSRDGDRVVVERGQRGTLPSLHPAESKIRFGHRSEAWVSIPIARQEWR